MHACFLLGKLLAGPDGAGLRTARREGSSKLASTTFKRHTVYTVRYRTNGYSTGTFPNWYINPRGLRTKLACRKGTTTRNRAGFTRHLASFPCRDALPPRPSVTHCKI